MKKIGKYNAAKQKFEYLPKKIQLQIQRNPGGMQEWHPGGQYGRWLPSLPGRTRQPQPACACRIFRAKPQEQVVIHVRGGVADIVKKSKGVDVTIRDFDNENRQ